MWFPRGSLISFLGLSTQAPLQAPPPSTASIMSTNKPGFQFKEGSHIFSPNDLISLARPGQGVANQAGDLLLVPITKYSAKDKKNNKSIFLAPIESAARPLEISLANGGEVFWLDTRTVAHAVSEGEDKNKVVALYAMSIKYEAEASDIVSLPAAPVLLGKFPTSTATNFRFNSHSGVLAFSDYVYADGNLTSVKEQDEAIANAGYNAYVFDNTYERHWDTWVGPKESSLFTVKLTSTPDHTWVLSTEFNNLLKGTGHHCPVEPFGGTDDFDLSEYHVVYTTLDPDLPPAWHTRQDVYIVDAAGKYKPRRLTSGKQGATHNPVLNVQGDKVAWLELDRDGFESDRAKIVIYDLLADVRYTLTEKWDRSPESLSFSMDGKSIFFTAGDIARVKTFVLPIPPTPAVSTTNPDLSAKYLEPLVLTSSGSVSGLQVLPTGRILFTHSSMVTPNDVFVMRGLNSLDLHSESRHTFQGSVEQLTRFTEDELQSKNLQKGEEFWFEGAEGKRVQGWYLKPPGFKEGEEKKWPAVLLIHGGPHSPWADSWSSRWNYQMFAQQGYFTVFINPTGSGSFGQEFSDAIIEDWGGKPFVDLFNGWKYVLDKFPEIDSDRAGAAGASWGGYAVNWIQSNPEFGFRFKALVCHDGVFDARYNGLSTDELFFFNSEWGGKPWEQKPQELFKKFNPSDYVHKWSTPQLTIHGSKDYRISDTEGIAVFHALQLQGVPSRLLIFPEENHWVLNHANSWKWHYEVFRWLDQFLSKAE